jgi:hypothetical protein
MDLVMILIIINYGLFAGTREEKQRRGRGSTVLSGFVVN